MHYRLLHALVVALVFAAGAGTALAQAPAPDWREGFRAHDKNGDSRIDRAEFQNWVVDGFFFRDQGRKGYLVQADLQGTVPPAVFQAMNQKRDGKLTLQEFLNALFQDFAAADGNQDGALTQDEVATYIQRARQ
jgi:Ca2+-binding EF-hand superfamily protein